MLCLFRVGRILKIAGYSVNCNPADVISLSQKSLISKPSVPSADPRTHERIPEKACNAINTRQRGVAAPMT